MESFEKNLAENEFSVEDLQQKLDLLLEEYSYLLKQKEEPENDELEKMLGDKWQEIKDLKDQIEAGLEKRKEESSAELEQLIANIEKGQPETEKMLDQLIQSVPTLENRIMKDYKIEELDADKRIEIEEQTRTGLKRINELRSRLEILIKELPEKQSVSLAEENEKIINGAREYVEQLGQKGLKRTDMFRIERGLNQLAEQYSALIQKAEALYREK